MTKQQLRNAYERYKITPMRSIYNVYKNPSPAKVKAYNKCVKDMKECCGHNGTIVSYNCNHFTYGYVINAGFVYVTYANVYVISWKDVKQNEN